LVEAAEQEPELIPFLVRDVTLDDGLRGQRMRRVFLGTVAMFLVLGLLAGSTSRDRYAFLNTVGGSLVVGVFVGFWWAAVVRSRDDVIQYRLSEDSEELGPSRLANSLAEREERKQKSFVDDDLQRAE
jgi:hypothetical protein